MTGMKMRAAYLLAVALGLNAAVLADEKAAAKTETREQIIYDTALAPGWQNWSWAKTELSAQINGSARKPIRVEAGAWEALYLHHEPFSTAGFTWLRLLIQGTAPDGQVRVHGLVNGKVASDGYPVKIGNSGWTQVKVPLATLGLEDLMADGFWVQNATAAPLPKFFVTEIKLE